VFLYRGRSARAELRTQAEIDAVVSDLCARTGSTAALRAMARAAASAAGVSHGSVPIQALISESRFFRGPGDDQILIGDLLFSDSSAFLILPVRSQLVVWEIHHHGSASRLDAFCAQVETCARISLDGRRVRGMEFDWSQIQHKSRGVRSRRRGVEQEGVPTLATRAVEHTADDSARARVLLDPARRAFVIRLAQALGKARSTDAATVGDSSITQPLIDAGIIRREYLVLCRQDSHTICSVHTRSHIDVPPGSDLRCTTCGRAFKDELVQEIYALTEEGRDLMNGSRWMTIWLTDLLISAGIERGNIAVNAVSGDDELDIIASVLNDKVFFELKDRDFGLGDAYPFAFRLSRYGGDRGVVATAGRVDAEAKKFLKEQNPAGADGSTIELLEGINEIEQSIPLVVDRVSRLAVAGLIQDSFPALGVNLLPLAMGWMKSRGTSESRTGQQTAEVLAPDQQAQGVQTPA
jgi:hypothetical protein